MNLKDAAANLNQAHPEDILHPLYTPWGEMMMRSGSYDDILSEYPRPQMKRTDYHTLNGLWEYAFVPADGSSSSEDPAYFTAQGSIRVPFSPEALLSGVHRRLEPTEYLWYHRELSFTTEELSQKEETMRCILHFDAVDQEATVFLGTKRLGTHSGGYLPFSLDITEYVNADPVSLYVKVRDLTDTGYATRGKQTLNRGGMFYTAQSGIWQSVWYEWVPENYVINYKITPEYNKASVTFVLCSPKPFNHLEFRVNIPSCDGTLAQENTGSLTRMRVRKISEQQDSFGLTHTTVVLSFRGSCQLAVLPEPVLSTRIRTGMEKQQEYRYSAVADDDSDILDLRAFRPGDNLNHIHWNLSLRTDDLIVRQYGEQIDVKKVILVDLSILNTAQYRSRMDAVYTAVASIANLYVENEVNTLILHGTD